MEVKGIQNKKIWEGFLLDCEEKTFLSSWHWGEFNKMMGNRIWRLGIYESEKRKAKSEKLIGVALVLKTKARRGTFLLVPHGPNIKAQSSKTKLPFTEAKVKMRTKFSSPLKAQSLGVLLDKLKEIAQDEKCDFIRINPIWEKNEGNHEVFKKLGFKSAPIHAHPEATLKLDIRPSNEELLAKMRKTTRYLIRQAERNQDIKIYQNTEAKDAEIFNNLQQEVIKSQEFIPFSLEYLRNELLAFQPDNQISIFFGEYQKKIVAAAFIIFWSKIGFYHHAALSPAYHKVPVAYLLLWEAIKEAKKRGCNLFDFWGYVEPQKNPRHPWAGPTLFKMGFGGKPYQYVKTQDFPLSPKYWLTFLFEKLRKIKRRL